MTMESDRYEITLKEPILVNHKGKLVRVRRISVPYPITVVEFEGQRYAELPKVYQSGPSGIFVAITYYSEDEKEKLLN